MLALRDHDHVQAAVDLAARRVRRVGRVRVRAVPDDVPLVAAVVLDRVVVRRRELDLSRRRDNAACIRNRRLRPWRVEPSERGTVTLACTTHGAHNMAPARTAREVS